MAEMDLEHLNKINNASSVVLKNLIDLSEDPAEALYIICLVIWRLNFEAASMIISIDDLVQDVSTVLYSIQKDVQQ